MRSIFDYLVSGIGLVSHLPGSFGDELVKILGIYKVGWVIQHRNRFDMIHGVKNLPKISEPAIGTKNSIRCAMA